MNYNWWIDHRNNLYQAYPKPKYLTRIDLELTNQELFLSDVKCFRNPHAQQSGYNGLGQWVTTHGTNYSATTCMYVSDNWSVVFGEPIHYTHPNGNPACRMIVESGHPDPTYGERIILFSNFTRIWTEPWGLNYPNLFVFYKNKFWLVSFYEFDGNYSENHYCPDNYTFTRIENSRLRRFRSSKKDDVTDDHADWDKYVYRALIGKNIDDLRVYADFYFDKGWEFAEYIQSCFWKLDQMKRERPEFDHFHRIRKLIIGHRPSNARGFKFMILLLMQYLYDPNFFVVVNGFTSYTYQSSSGTTLYGYGIQNS